MNRANSDNYQTRPGSTSSSFGRPPRSGLTSLPSPNVARQAALFGCEPAPARARARRSHPGTSFAAAASVKNLRRSQQAIVNLLRRFGPVTHEELIALARREGLKMSVSGVRSPCAEVVRLGQACDSGKCKRLPSGRLAILWSVPE